MQPRIRNLVFGPIIFIPRFSSPFFGLVYTALCTTVINSVAAVEKRKKELGVEDTDPEPRLECPVRPAFSPTKESLVPSTGRLYDSSLRTYDSWLATTGPPKSRPLPPWPHIMVTRMEEKGSSTQGHLPPSLSIARLGIRARNCLGFVHALRFWSTANPPNPYTFPFFFPFFFFFSARLVRVLDFDQYSGPFISSFAVTRSTFIYIYIYLYQYPACVELLLAPFYPQLRPYATCLTGFFHTRTRVTTHQNIHTRVMNF